jgi:hypothetical protein
MTVNIEVVRDTEGKITSIDGDEVPSDYRNPNFEAFDKDHKHVHEWLSYISNTLRVLWDGFEDIEKAAIAASAEATAGHEDWD